jgi:ABC-type uncharacterized transport system permease subunit
MVHRDPDVAPGSTVGPAEPGVDSEVALLSEDMADASEAAAGGPSMAGAASRLRNLGATVSTQVVAFVLSMALLIGVLALLGYDAGAVVNALWDGSVGSPFAISQSLSEAVPLLLTATAVWLAFQAGLFNIGADGQLQIGGLIALLVALHFPASAPTVVTIVLALVAGAIAGGFWAGIAGALRAYRGSNEVISTIMLNFIALEIINQLIGGALRSKADLFTPKTDEVPLGTQLGELIPGSGLPWIALIAIVVSVATILLVVRTTVGLRLRAVGLNGQAAFHGGLPVRRYQFLAFCASGAVAGLAGGLVILGYRYYIAPGWAPPWGFLGIVIAFLSLRTPLLIPVWAIILGMIGSAGPTLKGDASVPDSITTLMQTLPVIVLFVLYAGGRLLRRGGTDRPPWRARRVRAS